MQTSFQTSLPPSPPPPPSPQFSKPQLSLKVNEIAKQTMKWSAIANVAAAIASEISNYISNYFIGDWGEIGRAGETMGFLTTIGFNFSNLLAQLFWAAVWGAVGGFILAQYYELFKKWNIRYLDGRLNTLFKLLFYPTLIFSLVGLILSGGLSFIIGTIPLFIILIGIVISRLIYAEVMVKKVGEFYK